MLKAINNISGKRVKTVKYLSFVVFILLISLQVKAQMKDSVIAKPERELKNSIKINLTSWILYNSGIQMNYERLLSKKRSITLYGGYIEFPMPSIIPNTAFNFDKNRTKSGFSIGSEYRFYLASENKYSAPHGVYLAPFVSYYHFNNVRNGHDSTNQDQLTLNTTLEFLNIGGELGYQFVIKKHFVIDCVLLGPAVSSYYFSVKLNGSTSGDYNEHVQAILDALKEKYPLLKDLSNGAKFSSSGISNFWSMGFRYAIHIGYRF
jgi:hypothetical protein